MRPAFVVEPFQYQQQSLKINAKEGKKIDDIAMKKRKAGE
jgi:hypothetical protein